jgi:hypothetical protein
MGSPFAGFRPLPILVLASQTPDDRPSETGHWIVSSGGPNNPEHSVAGGFANSSCARGRPPVYSPHPADLRS